MPLALSIVTPERPVVEAEVDSVAVPGAEGEFCVLENHEPFLAPLRPGVVRYVSEGAEHRVAISGGFAEVAQERVTLLARTAETREEIDRERAEAARGRAEDSLRDTDPIGPREQLASLRAAAARAAARLHALG